MFIAVSLAIYTTETSLDAKQIINSKLETYFALLFCCALTLDAR